MIVANIPRPTGDLVIAIENHPKTGEAMVVISHIRPDETVVCRSPLRASELKDVISALQLSQTTLTARKAQHRTLTAAEFEAESKRLF